MNYSEYGNLSRVLRHTGDMFEKHGQELIRVRDLAREISELIESMSPFVQHNTEAVCPSCQNVCCINLHSYHDHRDIVYLHALGEKVPSYKKGIDDVAPCQFLGERGCMVNRSLRPYRCTWFFCTPLLDRIRCSPVSLYRRFIDSLQLLTQKRQDMMNLFLEISKEGFVDYSGIL